MPNQKGNVLFSEKEAAPSDGPVECLGLTFPSEEARRAHFLDNLKQKLQDPEFRKIEGFPIGTDEDILRLSDPPYYTACPNPFLEDFIRHYGTPYDPAVPYSREPLAVDVSEGKTDPIYTAHSYHTKVPHKAIMSRYPSLHAAGRYSPRWLCRLGHDRRGRTDVRTPRSRVQGNRGSRVASRR